MERPMAYDVYRRPATWVSRQAAEHRNRLLVFVSLLFAASCLGIVLRISHRPGLAALAGAASIALILAVWATVDRKSIEAANWIRGARAEKAIGELLNQLRSEGFIVMHDIEQAGEGNIDHLVSGPTGVFMIEPKAKRYQDEALTKAKRQAAKIHDELENWVVPVICIYKRDGKPFEHEKVWIIPKQHLLDWIRARHDTPVPFERLARWADTLPS